MAYRKRHHRFLARGEPLEPRLPLAAIAFIPHDVDVSEMRAYYVPADIDGDDDTDLVAATISSSGTIYWYENVDGKGAFGPPKVVASEGIGFPPQIEIADMDNDGDMDMVANTSELEALVWYENVDGLGTFGARKTITVDFFRPGALSVADMDSDGDSDVLGTFLSSDAIVWFENVDGRGTFGPGTERIVAGEPEAEDVYSVAAADLDGDGDMDVLANGGNIGLAWFENTSGQGTFGPPQSILLASSTPGSVAAADLDDDGDMDALAATDAGISWYENTDGRGRFGAGVVISDQPSASMVENSQFATDVDTDGDLDILRGDAWYENTDGRATFGHPQRLAISAGATADVDGDGDYDLIARALSGGLAWYENDLRILGDANGDDVFNQLDIVQVLQAGKFRTGEPATWVEGDWNADAVFDRLDIVAALQAGDFDPA